MRWARLFWLAGLSGLLVGQPAIAQSPAAGTLLVASEDLPDLRFARTVVLLLHYESDGALGIVLNRPTWVEPTAIFPEMGFLADYEGHIYIGGPVRRSNLLVLARGDIGTSPDAVQVLDGIYMSTEIDFLRRAAASAKDEGSLRLFAGHAAWSPRQLEREIAAGDWQVVPARADLVFASEPLSLWRRARAPGQEMTVHEDRSALRLLRQAQAQAESHLSPQR